MPNEQQRQMEAYLALQAYLNSPEYKLQQLQIQQVQEETDWNKMMRPQLLKQMGLVEENGTLRAATEQEKLAQMNPEEKSAYETDRLLAARQAKAAKGELGTPGYIENELTRQREQQGILASQRLGAKGARVSTPGIRGMANQMGTEAGVRSNYAYGQEQQGLGLLAQSGGYLGNQAARNAQTYGSFANTGMSLIPQGQLAAQPYTFGTQLLQSHNAMLEDRDRARRSGIASGIGAGIGSAVSMYTGGMMGGK